MQLVPSGPGHRTGRDPYSTAPRSPAPRPLGPLLMCGALTLPPSARAEEPADLSREQIVAVPVLGASRYEPAQDLVAVTVITRKGAALDGGEFSSWQWPQATRKAWASCGKRLDNELELMVSASILRTDAFGSGTFQGDRYTVAHRGYSAALSAPLTLAARAFTGDHRYECIPMHGGLPYDYPASTAWHGAELQLVSTALSVHALLVGTEYQRANPSLGGEAVDTTELVLDHRASADLHLRASLYRWKIDDLINLVADADGVGQYQAVGSVESRGLELSADHTWHNGARLRGNLSFQHATDTAGERVENSPRVLGRVNFSTPLPNLPLRMGVELAYDGKRRSPADNAVDAYWLSNLHLVAERWIPGAEVSLSVLNLFDEDYAHPSAGAPIHTMDRIVQDGRSLRVKFDYRF